jgi:hypothetical protein
MVHDNDADAASGESREYLEDLERATPRVQAILDADRRFAAHEAGHVVIACSLGLKVHSVTIDGGPHAAIDPAAELRHRIQVLLGGWLAEWIDNGRQSLDNGRDSAVHDDRRIEEEFDSASIPLADRATIKNECSATADRVLTARWKQVENLKVMLLTFKTLDDIDVRKTLWPYCNPGHRAEAPL